MLKCVFGLFKRGAPDAVNGVIFHTRSSALLFCLENMDRSINTNVSTSAMTRAERVIISELLVNVKEADACKNHLCGSISVRCIGEWPMASPT